MVSARNINQTFDIELGLTPARASCVGARAVSTISGGSYSFMTYTLTTGSEPSRKFFSHEASLALHIFKLLDCDLHIDKLSYWELIYTSWNLA